MNPLVAVSGSNPRTEGAVFIAQRKAEMLFVLLEDKLSLTAKLLSVGPSLKLFFPNILFINFLLTFKFLIF